MALLESAFRPQRKPFRMVYRLHRQVNFLIRPIDLVGRSGCPAIRGSITATGAIWPSVAGLGVSGLDLSQKFFPFDLLLGGGELLIRKVELLAAHQPSLVLRLIEPFSCGWPQFSGVCLVS
jgi:hypothetical protein